MSILVKKSRILFMPEKFFFRNACTERCDIAEGPCACGAWHKLEDWPKEVQECLKSSMLSA